MNFPDPRDFFVDLGNPAVQIMGVFQADSLVTADNIIVLGVCKIHKVLHPMSALTF